MLAFGLWRMRATLSAALLGAWIGFARADLPQHPVVVYLDSWNEVPATKGSDTSLAALPSYIAVVALAFARPDLVYVGGLDLSQTGLEYPYTGDVLRDAIGLLKSRNPATQVTVSLGGAIYRNWRDYDEAAVARLVHDLGADGVDLDYEPRWPGCMLGPDQHILCRSDLTMDALVRRTRAVLPRPAVLTASVWSVGAYGEGAYSHASPRTRYTGMMLGFLRMPSAASLDLLSVNAYDAGPQFDPLEAYRAYRSVWPGRMALGVAVQRADGSGPYLSADAVEELAREVAKDRGGSMMIYPLLARPAGFGSLNRPDGRELTKAACRGMALEGCDEAIP